MSFLSRSIFLQFLIFMIEALSGKEISSLTNYSNPNAKRDTSSQAQLQMDDFLQLLTSQITNQDPLEPMKDTEFISQMANIASLEQMQQFTQGFSKFAKSHDSMVAHGFLGKNVTINDDGRDYVGLVSAVQSNDDGTESLVIDGKSFDPAKVVKVSLNNISSQ